MDDQGKNVEQSDLRNRDHDGGGDIAADRSGAVVAGEEDEGDYVPDDEENSIDDEGTLEEQEALENDGDIADEVAALQEEQDIPVEELMRLYGYGDRAVTSKSSAIVGENDEITTEGNHSQNVGSITPESSSSSPHEPNAKMPRFHYHSEFSSFTVEGNGGHPIQDEDGKGGPSHEHGYFSTSDEDSEEDLDYVPEESWKKYIRIGPEYQAEVPITMVSMLDEIDSPDEADDCVWSPRTARLDEKAIEDYLKAGYQHHRAIRSEQRKQSRAGLAEESGVSQPSSLKRKIGRPSTDGELLTQNQTACLRDDETALKLLFDLHYDAEASLTAWKRAVSERKPGDSERPWMEEEQITFEDGLKAHGKNFRLIQQEFLPNRTVCELVRYYYLWKRTERHDVFVEQHRFEKRQYGLHPTATDYMDHFLDHMALVGATASASPSAPAFHQAEQHSFTSIQHHHHAYLSLLPSNANSRHSVYSSQPQKGSSEEAVVPDDLNNGNNVDSGRTG